MIYRAFCYSTHESMRFSTEQTVFFESVGKAAAEAKIVRLLVDIWNVPADSISYYNLRSESELFFESVGTAEDGDIRLLECGQENLQPIYLKMHEALLLLGPNALRRITLTWRRVP